ncbi:MAG: 50S ribosomal protein L18 [Candidatus Uhrbacteria bacterium]
MASRIEKQSTTLRQRRHKRVRARISGTAIRPRISVFRSAQHFSVQLIDDITGITIVAASDLDIKALKVKKGEQRKVSVAFEVGKTLAERAKDKGITVAVFDRGGYAYHGRVKAAADGAREGGLTF